MTEAVDMKQAEMLGKLTALKQLGRLSEIRPVIVVDSREQTPLRFQRLESVRGNLYAGDYSALGIEHLFAVERKSLPDLVTSVCSSERPRFERELSRLRGYRFKRLLVVSSWEALVEGEYRSQAHPRSVMNSLKAFEMRYDVPFVFIEDPSKAAQQIESWAYWFCRELCEQTNDILRGHTRIERNAS